MTGEHRAFRLTRQTSIANLLFLFICVGWLTSACGLNDNDTHACDESNAEFDPVSWRAPRDLFDPTRFRMVEDLVDSGQLQGLSETQVVDMLGPSEVTPFASEGLTYRLGQPCTITQGPTGAYLVIRLQVGRVESVRVELEDAADT